MRVKSSKKIDKTQKTQPEIDDTSVGGLSSENRSMDELLRVRMLEIIIRVNKV